MNNVFFAQGKKEEKKDFDAYSKSPKDIFTFYQNKYPEVDLQYKSPIPFGEDTLEESEALMPTEIDQAQAFIAKVSTPFELYMLAFVFHMQGKLQFAELCFNKSIDILEEDHSLSQSANRAMMKLQLSQLYDRMRKRDHSTRMLLSIIHDFRDNEELLAKYNNLLASTYMRLGVYVLREYKLFKLSQCAFFLSIRYRNKFKDNYPPLVYEQYLATALRNYGLTFQDPREKYLFFKESLEKRFLIMESTSDEFNKVEAVYTLCDALRFLILAKFKNDLVVKYSRRMYTIISSMKSNTRDLHSMAIVQYGLMLSKYFFHIADVLPCILWFKVAKHASKKTNPGVIAELKKMEEGYMAAFL